MIAFLTRAVRFSASHSYYRPDWSEEENRRRFGALLGEHGHEYRCEVTVRGEIDPEMGMVMDLELLDAILDEEVVERFHDRSVNAAAERFAPGGALPTTENLAAYILERVAARLPPGVSVHRVRIMEDPDLWSDVYGPGTRG